MKKYGEEIPTLSCHNFAMLMPSEVIRPCMNNLEELIEGTLLMMQYS